MHVWLPLLAALFGVTATLQAGPAPYTSAKIYILDPNGSYKDSPTPDYIRQHAEIVLSMQTYTIDFFASLHWEKAKHDPSIKDRATPLVMIIDFYNRVQPEPPEEPRFNTLYCTEKYGYTEGGDYIDIRSIVARTFKFPLRN